MAWVRRSSSGGDSSEHKGHLGSGIALAGGSSGDERSQGKLHSVATVPAGSPAARAAAQSSLSGNGRHSLGRPRRGSGSSAANQGAMAEEGSRARRRSAPRSHESLESAKSVEKWLAESSADTWSPPAKADEDSCEEQGKTPLALSTIKVCVHALHRSHCLCNSLTKFLRKLLSLFAVHVQGKLVVSRRAAQQHRLWLTFADPGLEREFGAWHSLQLSKVLLCVGTGDSGVCTGDWGCISCPPTHVLA